ncbi:FtsB family cell division protein [Ornithinibacillus halophilus]|uniref:Cell division protein DivIC n=1 Tax=Ornithinibacillus halophilus TaxID=930117 RepID=A0A1M5JJ04_9BACI|nr:septum formation initiator family protein [Ornithinibacillus halophilus]SHG40574.1 cell division protein DivIC [Ornithinibacillus halophilus]
MSVNKSKVSKIHPSYVQQYDVYQERQNRRKKLLKRRLIFFAILVAIIIGSLTVYHFKQREIHAEKLEEYNQLKEELTHLQNLEVQYKEEIELLNNDSYILDIARTNYFLSKKGELIFKIPDEDPSY